MTASVPPRSRRAAARTGGSLSLCGWSGGSLLVRIASGVDGVPQPLEALALDVARGLVSCEEVQRVPLVGDLSDARAEAAAAQQAGFRAGSGSGGSERVHRNPGLQAVPGACALAVLVLGEHVQGLALHVHEHLAQWRRRGDGDLRRLVLRHTSRVEDPPDALDGLAV